MQSVVIGNATLYHGNCLDIMPSLVCVDATMTDPPYEDHMHDAKSKKKRSLRTDGHAELQELNFASINSIRQQVANEVTRLSNGWALIFCTPEGVAPWRDAIEVSGAKYKRACVWVKPDAAPQFNGQGPAMGAEMFVSAWCGKGFSEWNGGGRRGVFTFPCNPSDRTGLHPAEKPVALMSELVTLFSNHGETVFDPFMGVGSTGVACAKYGRKFIGIEADKTYFDAACRRIEAAYQQPDFFVRSVAETVSKQVGLFDAALA